MMSATMTQNVDKMLVPLTDSDRDNENKILPDVRERVLSNIEIYIKTMGYINIAEIARDLKVHRDTAKNLIEEVLAVWREEDSDRILAQIAYYESKMREVELEPEKFGALNEVDKVRLKSGLMDKVNMLSGVRSGTGSMDDSLNIHIWGKLSPQTIDLMRQQENK